MGSAQTRSLFEKSETKNFPLRCGANTPLSTVEHTNYDKKITPFFKVFERWGFGEEKLFSKSFLPRIKTIKTKKQKGGKE